ncbi:pyridoxamine 5'-phosphate oxidase family protein [Haloarchaeobius sp. HRN-SO-5]|uniref:pyridoxamine 5'-phosphate oxidase family protein n=1 Tax=Haloarchaeobius sp. HRN-SO-5 TaxID=3446118 RepID=UPI003EBD7D14
MASVSQEVEGRLASEPLVAYLATASDDRPHVAPVWFNYDDGVVEVVTTGRKLADVRANPRVSLAVGKDTGGDPEWAVTLRGTATVVDDPAETAAANARINRKYGAPEDAWSENVLVRIEVGSATLQTY